MDKRGVRSVICGLKKTVKEEGGWYLWAKEGSDRDEGCDLWRMREWGGEWGGICGLKKSKRSEDGEN